MGTRRVFIINTPNFDDIQFDDVEFDDIDVHELPEFYAVPALLKIKKNDLDMPMFEALIKLKTFVDACAGWDIEIELGEFDFEYLTDEQ